jgi:hypothetical protein
VFVLELSHSRGDLLNFLIAQYIIWIFCIHKEIKICLIISREKTLLVLEGSRLDGIDEEVTGTSNTAAGTHPPSSFSHK